MHKLRKKISDKNKETWKDLMRNANLTPLQARILDLRNEPLSPGGVRRTIYDVAKIVGKSVNEVKREEMSIRLKISGANYKHIERLEHAKREIEKRIRWRQQVNHILAEAAMKNTPETSLESLELPPRTERCLKKVGVKTIEDLLKFTKKKLREHVHGLGEESVGRILAALHKRGLSLEDA